VKVLVVSRSGWLFPAPPGGADMVALRQSLALAQAGADVVLVGQGSLPEGAPMGRLRLVDPGIGRTIGSTSQAAYYFKVLAFAIVAGVRGAGEVRRDPSIAVVHGHHSASIVLLRLLAPRRATVVTVHDNPFDRSDLSGSAFERFVRIANNLLIERLGVTLADRVVGVSPEVVRRLRRWGCPDGKVVELWPTAPERSEPSGADRSATNLEPTIQGRFLLSVGDLTQRKRMDILLRALPLLPADLRLVIVGRGPRKAEFERLAAELGLGERATFLDYVSESRLRSLQRTASVAVLVSEREGLPTSLIEAVSEGTPAFYATVRPVSVPDTRPFLVHLETSSPQVVAEAVARICDQVAAGLTREQVRLWASEHFPSSAAAQTLLRLYSGISTP